MTLDLVPIQDVNRDHLASLVEDGVAELRSVDYKRELPGRSDSARREFAADVSSFANAAGGDIIFGITEEGGVPQDLPGFVAEDMDAEMNRLEQTLRGGLEPRIEGIGLQPVALEDGRHALVLRVPRSPARPHAVTNGDRLRF